MKRVLTYCGVAGASAGVDWCVFVLLTQIGINHLPAIVVSRLAGGIFAFLSHRGWTFSAGEVSHITVQGRRFLLLYVVSYSLALGQMYLFVDIMAIPVYWAKLVADTVCFAVNFVAMRHYVYHERGGFIFRARRYLGLDA